ncbi:MAG: ParB N-terminal domain-containing protein [Methylococcaceae bacterium]|jgi:ParB-like chromosome segregation protein Spo0J
MIHYLNTIQEFKDLRDTLQPAYINSKRYGKIPVPCANTILVARDLIIANNYNPNFVAKDKMNLLKQSIRDNGFCFPIVTIFDEVEEKFIVIDGFHRKSMGDPAWLDLDYIPLVFVEHDISKRMYATVQFNKARGVHQVDLDADVIRALIEQGKNEEEISIHLGIDIETIHRYKQLTGIAELFKNAEYSMPWTTVEIMQNG